MNPYEELKCPRHLWLVAKAVDGAMFGFIVGIGAVALIALILAITPASTEAGIFKPGRRYIFNWRRPAVDEAPDQDNAQPIVDPAIVGPSPAQVAVIAEVKKKLAAIEDAEKESKAKESIQVEAAPPPETPTPFSIPDWALAVAPILGWGSVKARRAATWIS